MSETTPKNEQKIMIIVVVMLVIAILGGVSTFFFVRNASKTTISLNTFIEKELYKQMQLTSVEKQNILEVLNEEYFEKESIAGFYSSGRLYHYDNLKWVLELLTNLGEDEMFNSVKNKHRNKMVAAEENAFYDSIINFLLYLDIADMFNIIIDQNKIIEKLSKNFDDENALFYYFVKGDLLATKHFYQTIKKYPQVKKYFDKRVADNLLNVYNNYNFGIPNGENNFFDSGAAIISAVNTVLGKSYIEKEKHTEWFNAWKSKMTGILGENMLREVGEILGINVDTAPLKEDALAFIDKYIADYPTSNGYYQELVTYAKYLDLKEFESYSQFKDCLNSFVNNEMKVMSCEPAISTTYWGVVLAQKCGFEYDSEKINAFLSNTYEKLKTEVLEHKFASDFYCAVMLDFALDGKYSVTYKQFESQISNSIENNTNLSSVVKVFEASCMLSNGAVKMNKSLISKLDSNMNEMLADRENISHINYADAILIKKILGKSTPSDAFDDFKRELYLDGGYKIFYNNEKADIDATFTVAKLGLCGIKEFKFTAENKNFINNLKIKDGIYSHSVGNKYFNVGSIFYCNLLNSIAVV